MNRKPFQIGIPIEDNTEYYATQPRYDVYLQDTVPASRKQYLSLSPRGNLTHLDTFLYLDGKKNVTFDFGGAEILLHGRIQPILLDNCENVTIKNCSVKYDRSFYTEFRITEIGEDFIKVTVDDAFPYRFEDGKIIPTSEFWETPDMNMRSSFLQAFDPDTCEGVALTLAFIGREVGVRNDPFASRVKHYVPIECEDGLILQGYVEPAWKVGNVLCFTHEPRNLASVYLFNSKNTTLENYRVMNGTAMGIAPTHCENIYLRKLIFHHDETSPGIVTNAADAIHAIACSGDFEITDSIIEGMVDDGLNVHSNFYAIESISENQILAHFPGHGLSSYLGIFQTGDQIGIYNGQTVERTAEYTLTDVSIPDDRHLLFTLDRPAIDHKVGDTIENLTCQPNLTIRNTVFDKANSHLRIQTRGKVRIEDCKITLPVLLTGDMSFWYESSPVNNLVFDRVKFASARAQIRPMPEFLPTEQEPYYHKNVTVQNCTFVSDTPIEGGYTDNIVFTGNINTAGLPMTLTLTNCGTVTAENCEVIRKTEVKTELHLN